MRTCTFLIGFRSAEKALGALKVPTTGIEVGDVVVSKVQCLAPPRWTLYVLPGSVWILSRSSNFLPQTRHAHQANWQPFIVLVLPK